MWCETEKGENNVCWELERERVLNQKLAKISEHPIFSGFDWTFFFKRHYLVWAILSFWPIKRKERKQTKSFDSRFEFCYPSLWICTYEILPIVVNLEWISKNASYILCLSPSHAYLPMLPWSLQKVQYAVSSHIFLIVTNNEMCV